VPLPEVLQAVKGTARPTQTSGKMLASSTGPPQVHCTPTHKPLICNPTHPHTNVYTHTHPHMNMCTPTGTYPYTHVQVSTLSLVCMCARTLSYACALSNACVHTPLTHSVHAHACRHPPSHACPHSHACVHTYTRVLTLTHVSTLSHACAHTFKCMCTPLHARVQTHSHACAHPYAQSQVTGNHTMHMGKCDPASEMENCVPN
jgi:hypothetical protein